jgi:two-component system response regulator AtoC
MPKLSPIPGASEPVHDSSSTYWEIGGHPNYLLSVDERVVAARELLAQVADTSVTVMLGGERGVGKEVLARGIHNMSSRRESPFVALNAYAVPKSAIAKELFGNGTAGKLQSVGDGTLLIHGLELLPEEVRARLLDWKRRAVREADAEPRFVLSYESPSLARDDVSALERAWSTSGGAVRVELPPLRDRREDIPLLANHVLQKYSTFYGSRIRVLRSSFVRFLQAYRWPGNTRELERVIRRYLVIEDEEAIRAELGSKQGPGGSLEEEELLEAGVRLKDIVARSVARVEARAISAALQRTRWNKKRAAVELGISYKSLLNKIHQYHLES